MLARNPRMREVDQGRFVEIDNPDQFDPRKVVESAGIEPGLLAYKASRSTNELQGPMLPSHFWGRNG
tara:strand:+ start:3471 stop:3671 length:201 start_codon:yes stop_codon:yes gene_type:complete